MRIIVLLCSPSFTYYSLEVYFSIFCFELHQRLLHMEYVTNILFLQAIDPRTRMVLFKMLNRGVFHDINGCISTGKEVCMNFNFCTDDTYCMFQFLILKKLNHSIFFPLSQQANVYHAIKADSQELAIKVYKTSILVFKYVEMSLLAC